MTPEDQLIQQTLANVLASGQTINATDLSTRLENALRNNTLQNGMEEDSTIRSNTRPIKISPTKIFSNLKNVFDLKDFGEEKCGTAGCKWRYANLHGYICYCGEGTYTRNFIYSWPKNDPISTFSNYSSKEKMLDRKRPARSSNNITTSTTTTNKRSKRGSKAAATTTTSSSFGLPSQITAAVSSSSSSTSMIPDQFLPIGIYTSTTSTAISPRALQEAASETISTPLLQEEEEQQNQNVNTNLFNNLANNSDNEHEQLFNFDLFNNDLFNFDLFNNDFSFDDDATTTPLTTTFPPAISNQNFQANIASLNQAQFNFNIGLQPEQVEPDQAKEKDMEVIQDQQITQQNQQQQEEDNILDQLQQSLLAKNQEQQQQLQGLQQQLQQQQQITYPYQQQQLGFPQLYQQQQQQPPDQVMATTMAAIMTLVQQNQQLIQQNGIKDERNDKKDDLIVDLIKKNDDRFERMLMIQNEIVKNISTKPSQQLLTQQTSPYLTPMTIITSSSTPINPISTISLPSTTPTSIPITPFSTISSPSTTPNSTPINPISTISSQSTTPNSTQPITISSEVGIGF